jgi:Flp pilus assembly pilin Flp
MRQFIENKQGDSAVEFALIAPFMLLLVAAILAYGSLFATSLSLKQVAQKLLFNPVDDLLEKLGLHVAEADVKVI